MAEELRESQENFQRTVARVEDVIYSVDLGTHEFSFLSPAFERLLGYTPDDIRGMGGRRAFLSRVMQGGEFERQEGIVGQLLAEGRLSDASYHYEAWWLCKDGTLKCLEDRWVPIYDGESLVSTDGVLRDITDRKQAEKELRTHAHQQAVVTELGQMALARADLSQLMDEATSLLAQSLAVEYSKVLELLPDGKSLLLRAGVGWKEGYVGHATVGAGTESQAGYTLLCSEPVIVEDLRTETRFSGPPLLHDHGVASGISTVIHGKDRPFGVLGAHTTRRRTFTKDDVHFLQALASVLATAIERKRAEDALTEERNLLRTLMDNLPDYIFIKDTKSRYVIDNDVRIRIMGARTSEEVVGKTDFDFFPRELAEKYYADDQSVIRSGQPLFGREEPVIDPSGNRVWFLTTRVPLRDSSGRIVGLVGTSRDITEDKKLREELARSEKLSAIGQIAAGIAHEIRNPLGSIVTAAHLLSLRERMAVKGDNLKLLRTIKFEAKRLNGILTDFLTFARPRKLHLRESDVNEILEDVLSLLKSDPALSLKVSIQENLQPSLPQIRIDRDQIKQVIWNIALNALQAMPEGGKLRVASEVGDGHLKVRVRDSGVGISQDDLGRIFQPFYTSKKGGTGLGLSIAHRIVEAHGGSIDVKTKVGRGTEFTITLPMR
jgi:PAS domain S-box-containing protein